MLTRWNGHYDVGDLLFQVSLSSLLHFDEGHVPIPSGVVIETEQGNDAGGRLKCDSRNSHYSSVKPRD